MASNYTENYGLCQWEATDQVRREEFNEDNAKIDEALVGIQAANHYIKLKEIVTDHAARQIDLDVSDIDFSQYLKVELFIYSPGCTENIWMQTNNLTTGYHQVQISGGGSGGTTATQYLALIQPNNYGVLLFYTPYPNSRVGCVSITSNGSSSFSGYQYTAPCTWSQLKILNFKPWETALPKGSKIVLYGIRA